MYDQGDHLILSLGGGWDKLTKKLHVLIRCFNPVTIFGLFILFSFTGVKQFVDPCLLVC